VLRFTRLLLALTGAPTPAGEVHVRPPLRVVVLLSQESEPYRATAEAFVQHLTRSGSAPEVEIRLVARPGTRRLQAPQVILAVGTPALSAGALEYPGVPIVGVTLHREDLERVSAATGVFLHIPAAQELEWMRRLLPGLRRVGVIYNPAENAVTIARAKEAAESMGLVLVARSVGSRDRLPAALESLAREVDVLWGIPDSVALTPATAQSLLLFGFRNRIAFVGLSQAWVRAGALYALDRDWEDIGRQSGELALLLLNGRAATTIPAQPPRRVVYYLNQKTALALKLELPAATLAGAAEVLR